MATTLALSITSGQTVKGVVNVTASLGTVAAEVRFFLDGSQVSEDLSYPWVWAWDTRLASDGSHTVEVRAIRNGRIIAKRSTTVTIDNVPGGSPTTTTASFALTGTGSLTWTPVITTGTVLVVYPSASVYPSDNPPTTSGSRTLIVYQAELEVPAASTDRRLVVYQAELEVPT